MPKLRAVAAAVALIVYASAQAEAPLAPERTAMPAPCRLEGVAHEVRCGRVVRPLDPLDPKGRSIEIHFAVLPAIAQRRNAAPVFFVAGGPGQSAIDLAGVIQGLLARLAVRRDIVLVDLRGTGRSAPLRCPEPPLVAPLRESADPARQVRRIVECRAALQRLPHGDLRQYTTTIAAADLDAVRRAIGAERIDLVGMSYGTRVALEVLRVFPQSVRRMVLDGVAPPDTRLPHAAGIDAQAAFDAMLAACDADAGCRSRHPQLGLRWRALLDSLPREFAVAHPVTGEVETLTVTPAALLGLVRAPLYAPAFAAGLPAAINAAAAGRLEPLVGLASAAGSRRGGGAIAEGLHFSVICSEDEAAGAPPESVGDFAGVEAALYREVCSAWPRGEVPQAFRTIPPAPVAVLLLSGGADPATPPRHADRVARSLGAKARHEVVPNAAHGVLALPCVRDAMYRFIDAETDLQAMEVSTDCAREVPRPTSFVPVGGTR